MNLCFKYNVPLKIYNSITSSVWTNLAKLCTIYLINGFDLLVLYSCSFLKILVLQLQDVEGGWMIYHFSII